MLLLKKFGTIMVMVFAVMSLVYASQMGIKVNSYDYNGSIVRFAIQNKGSEVVYNITLSIDDVSHGIVLYSLSPGREQELVKTISDGDHYFSLTTSKGYTQTEHIILLLPEEIALQRRAEKAAKNSVKALAEAEVRNTQRLVDEIEQNRIIQAIKNQIRSEIKQGALDSEKYQQRFDELYRQHISTAKETSISQGEVSFFEENWLYFGFVTMVGILVSGIMVYEFKRLKKS